MPHHIAPNRKNLAGMQFGRLSVIGWNGKKTAGRGLIYLCLCSCGKHKDIAGESLVRGLTRSCGCLQKEKPFGKDNHAFIHGLTESNTYRSWSGMIQRCTNANNPKFKRYGGRGISVCRDWLTFSTFLKDMGECPVGYSIERVNNDGNYEPSNCIWLPQKEQARNKSTSRRLTFNGRTLTVSQWAEQLSIPYTALRMRLHRGWDTIRTLSTPV